jgi:hypothetical protein
MLLPLMLFAAQPQLSCQDYDWLAKGVYKSELLSSSEKLDFIFRFMEVTDPACFRVGTKDAND